MKNFVNDFNKQPEYCGDASKLAAEESKNPDYSASKMQMDDLSKLNK